MTIGKNYDFGDGLVMKLAEIDEPRHAVWFEVVSGDPKHRQANDGRIPFSPNTIKNWILNGTIK